MRQQRLKALFVFGLILFTFPLLSVFNVSRMMGGIPMLYVYLFGAWIVVVLLLRLAMLGLSTRRNGTHPRGKVSE